jgi:hypothetical protein
MRDTGELAVALAVLQVAAAAGASEEQHQQSMQGLLASKLLTERVS